MNPTANESAMSIYTGCLIRARLPFVEKSARAVLEKLGIRVEDIEGATCCPEPVGSRGLDPEIWLTLAARNLALMQAGSNPCITLCPGCQSTFREAETAMKEDGSLRARVVGHLNSLGHRYEPDTTIHHIAHFLYHQVGAEKLSSLAVRSWKGFPVAVHYGCHLLRPSHLIRFDDPEYPTKLEELVRSLGADAVEYPRKMLCCGAAVQGADEELSLRMAHEKLSLIKEHGARALIVVCPTCMLQFDMKQRLIEEASGETLELPILYLTEFIGLALGMTPSDLGLKYHRVDPMPVVRELFPEGDSGESG